MQLSENLKLGEVDVSCNKELVQLYLTYTSISTWDITNNPLLKTLYVEKKLEIKKSEKLSDFKPKPLIIIKDKN